jgi:hypothetical protein
MQRIIVDLPEPDGPMTTTTSCLPTLRLMSRSATNEPNFLTTRCSSIITSPVPATWVASAKTSSLLDVVSVSLISSPLPTWLRAAGSRGSS